MSKRITIGMAMLGTAVAAAGAVAAPKAETTWHPAQASYVRTSDIPSHHERYRAALTFDPTVERDGVAGRVTVTTRDGRPVSGARLMLESSMPDHDSIAPMPLASEEIGGGAYRVRGMRFDRDGLWTVRLVIATATSADSLAFNVIR